MSIKLIIIDRDGVINFGTSEYITTPEDWIPLPGSLEAIVKLKRAESIVIVATNQSCVAKGLVTTEGLNLIHAKMQQMLQTYEVQIDQILICPHLERDNCLCRKPKPGMLLEAAKNLKVDFNKQQVPYIGDSDVDLKAAVACGAVPVLVKTGKGIETLKNAKEYLSKEQLENLLVFEDLNAFTNYWLNNL